MVAPNGEPLLPRNTQNTRKTFLSCRVFCVFRGEIRFPAPFQEYRKIKRPFPPPAASMSAAEEMSTAGGREERCRARERHTPAMAHTSHNPMNASVRSAMWLAWLHVTQKRAPD